MGKRLFSGMGLLAVIVITVAGISLMNWILRGARVDLSDGNVFTLSDASKQLLGGLQQNIQLTFYYSDSVSEGMADLRNYAEHVREMLEEVAEHSGGKITLKVVDPAPFSEAEDEAAAARLQAVPANVSGDSIYLGLAGSNEQARKEIIAFFHPERERFLEYEIDKLVYALDRQKPPVIGIVSALPTEPRFDFNTGQQSGGWVSVSQLAQTFEVRRPQLNDPASLADIDVLVLIHPKALTPQALYAVDQFVLRGGRLIAFLDPHSDNDTASMGGMMQMPAEDNASSLEPLLAAWGVSMSKAVVGDPRYALTISMGRNQPPARHLGILGIDRDGLNAQDVITSQLSQVNVATAGALSHVADSTTTFEPLIRSSADAGLIEAEKFRFLGDPRGLMQGFQPGDSALTIAARVSGKVKSAYPDGPPPPAAEPQPADEPSDAEGESAPAPLPESADGPPGAATPAAPAEPAPPRAEGDVNVILVADTDLLSDALWVQVQDFFGQRVASPFANNGDFLVNAVEFATGSTALVNVRGRAGFQRPFTRVADLMRRADERMVAKQQQLQQQLTDTEGKLVELERKRDGTDGALLSTEQQQELLQFQQQKLSIRRELRQVQRDLTLDIERLGSTLKLLNILAVPLLLSIALMLWQLRKRRVQRAK